IQQQIAITVVIPVKETSLLFTVQRQVGSVHVENDFFGNLLLVGLQENLHHEFIDRVLPERDLLVAVIDACAQLHSVERAFPCQRRLQPGAARKNAEEGIGAQLLVIIEVFVSQSQTVNPL